MGTSYRIRVAREAFKFSCAHMTVFPDGRKERLHGHNYFVGLELELADTSFENVIDFGPLKAAVIDLVGAWKERTIVATENPMTRVVRDEPEEDGGELEFTVCGKRYVIPREDALLLPIDNATVERLAEHLCELLLARLAPSWPDGVVRAMEVTVRESPGQDATVRREL